MENRLYDFGSLVDSFANDLRPKAIERLLVKYLKAGAHPYFLKQTIRLATTEFSSQKKAAINDLADSILRDSFFHREVVPEAWGIQTRKAVSRICEQPGKSQKISDPGILYGVIVEFYADVVQLFREGNLKNITEEMEWLSEKVLGHDLADFGVLDMLQHAINSILEYVEGESIEALPFAVTVGGHDSSSLLAKVKKRERIEEIIYQFIWNRISKQSIQETISEVLETWNEKAPVRVFAVFIILLDIFSKVEKELPFTKVLNFLLSISPHGDSRSSHAARRVLRREGFGKMQIHQYVNAFPSLQCANALYSLLIINSLVSDLKEELPALQTRHAIIRWLKRVPEQIELITFLLMFDGSAKIDSRAETLFEDIFGKGAWEAICAFQDPSLWEMTEDIYPGFLYRGGVKHTTSQYQVFREALRKSNLKRHELVVAEGFEQIVEATNFSLEEMLRILEYHLNLLSGEIVLAATHLRDEWMSFRKKPDEFLGAAFPEIEICRHKLFGDNGAACRFRFKIPGLATKLQGSLSPEGEAELENTPILNDQSKLAIRTMITQTVCDVLIPHFADTLPSLTHGGQWIPAYETPWTRRPVVHTVGKIEEDSENDRIESTGTKISSVMVELLFKWLLDKQPDYSFRLYIIDEEKIAGESEFYFRILQGAREKILDGKLELNEVYMRVVRAHTRPAGVYLDETKTLRVRKMSVRAKRNYDRYRTDGGRELDFSTVLKTYIVQDCIRIPVLVPRTFVQGSFASLREAFDFIFNRELKEKVRQTFKL